MVDKDTNVGGVKVSGINNVNLNQADFKVTGDALNDIFDQLKSQPKLTKCPTCKENQITNVVHKVNPISLVTCLCCGCCWEIFMLLKKKDLNCYDADHWCSKCGKVCYYYKSC